MIKCYSQQSAETILSRYRPWIHELCARYGLPDALLRAVLYKEMTEMDRLDLAADIVAASGIFRKKDSSTGYGQVFGKTAVTAVNFAVDYSLTTYKDLGLPTDRRLDENSVRDCRTVWKCLYKDKYFNIEIAALTLLCAAHEMTGRYDFGSFDEQELKLILTRYNADVKQVTPYGEEVFALYQKMISA